MYKPVHAIEVRIWGKSVGAVALAPKILSQVADAVAAWPDFAALANVSRNETTRILAHHRVL